MAFPRIPAATQLPPVAVRRPAIMAGMRFLLLIVAVLYVGWAHDARGQGGLVALHTDEFATECNGIPGSDVGTVNIFVFHHFHNGVNSVSYRVQNCGTTLSWVGDHNFFGETTGTSLEGVSVMYGTCQAADVLIQRIEFSGNGTSPLGSGFRIVPHPDKSQVEATDCADTTIYPDAGWGVCYGIDDDCDYYFYGIHTSIPCLPRSELCQPVPIQDTTWGKIKLLYE